MRDELATLQRWQAQGDTFALATVTSTSSSAPRPPGATLGVHPDGEVVGSVSGGCVEAAVVEIATRVLASGTAERATFGVSDDEAQAVGLTCGGTIEVFVRPLAPDTLDLAALARHLDDQHPVAVATIVDHPDAAMIGRSLRLTDTEVVGSSGNDGLDHAVVEVARGLLAQGATGLRHLGEDGQRRLDTVTVLVESFAPRPRLLVFGAIDFASAVASIGRFLGFHVTVCDARARFATPARFPDADEVVVDWPHRYLAGTRVEESTAICVLTHDPKFDVPVLVEALRTDAGYLGVMGSRRTHRDRLERLREAGVAEADLARLRSPIGLDLGGRTPQETAVSIAAELLMIRHGATGRPLMDTHGTIHREHQARTGDDR